MFRETILKKQLATLFLAVTSLSSSAGVLIDDGIVARDGLFPTVVRINNYYIDPKTKLEIPAGHCTGTLVAQDIVLTAAHCVVNLSKDLIQRVSHTGDSKGETAKKHKGGGIKVKAAYRSDEYKYANLTYEMANVYEGTDEFKKLDEKAKNEFYMKRYYIGKARSAYDIAFLQLERAQSIAKSKLSGLGCRISLVDGSNITLAGYGVKNIKGSKVDSNSKYVLNYGTNKLSKNYFKGSLYTLENIAGKQMVNSGDSGGPLFVKGSQAMVFGVTSTKAEDENGKNVESTYANLSSTYAQEVYREILGDKTIPKSLATILNSCP